MLLAIEVADKLPMDQKTSASPGHVRAGLCFASQTLNVSSFTPRLSMVSYLFPSPDWFVGLHSFPLCQNSTWITSARIPLFPFDMGTHDGENFALSEISSQPANPVTRFIYNTHSLFFDASLCASRCLQCCHDVP